MKGHLGFPCRACLRPSYPTNLRQSGIGLISDRLYATLAWDAPESAGSGPIIQYRVEMATSPSANEWVPVSYVSGTGNRVANLSWCYEGGFVRVSAGNRCGWGPPFYFNGWTFVGGTTVALITSSGTLSPPCWATSFTAYCVGCGGTSPDGGGGGGLAWKTWTRSVGQAWGVATCVVRNAANSSGPAISSMTYDGSTVAAYGGSANENGGYSGGDGGAGGRGGGTDNASFSAAGLNYSGNYYYGGAIGGCDPGGPGGTMICPSPVANCQRRPARDRNSLLSVASLAGLKVSEDCGTEAAFGSGGVRVPVASYGEANHYWAPGYGGGGFDSTCPGGSGCILVHYS